MMPSETPPAIPKPDVVPQDTPSLSNESNRALLWSITIAVILVILFGAVMIHNLIDRNRTQSTAQLQSIAELKSDEIGRWLEEHYRDAEMMLTAKPLIKAIMAFEESGDSANREFLVERLATIKQIYGYQAISILDNRGRFLLGAGGHKKIATTLYWAYERAISTGRIQFTDLYRDQIADDEHLHFDFVVPFAGELGFALVMRLDTDSFLFPFLQQWPLPSPSAETLLFRRDGESVLFLNDLRHRHDTALKLRIPLNELNVLGVQVIDGRAKIDTRIEGVDYRGKQVVGVAHAVAGTSWYLIAKMDHEEINQVLRHELILLVLGMILSLFVVIGGGILMRQRQKLQIVAERQRYLAESSLDTVFQVIPDIFFRLEEDGTILDYRAQSTSKLYVPPEVFLGKRMQDVLPPPLAGLFKENLLLANESGELVTYEYFMGMPQGERRYEARLISLGENSQLITVVRDITEQYRAKELLKESEDKYRALYDNAPLSYQSLDKEGCFNDVNPAWLETMGYDREEVVGECFIDFLHPDSKALFKENFPKFKQLGAIHDVQFKMRHKDGHYLDVSFEGRAGLNADGTFRQTYCVFQDITRRKQADEVLRIERDNLKNIFEAMDDGIYIVNQQYDIQYVNPMLIEDFGPYDGKKCYEYFHDLGDVCTWCRNADVFAGKTVHWEWTSSRSQKTYDLIDTPLMNPDGTVSKLEIFRDITNRKKMENALRESEEKFRALVTNSEEIIYMIASDGTFLLSEGKGLAALGLKSGEVVGASVFDLYKDYPEMLDKMRIAFNGETVTSEDNVGGVYFKSWYTPHINAEGESVGLLGLSVNITEQKQAEKKISRYNRMLENSLNEIYIIESESLRFIEVNRGARDNLGYSMEELRAMTPLDIAPEFAADSMAQILAPLLTGEEEQLILTTVHRRKDGSHYPIEMHLELIQDDTSVFVAFVIDITERKKSEDMQQQANLIIKGSLAVLFSWRVNDEWTVELVSENVNQFGYTAKELMSGEVPYLSIIHPDDLERVKQEVKEYSASGADHFLQEYRIVSPVGDVYWIDDQTSIQRDSSGNIVSYQGIVINVTERKRMEEDLRKLAQVVEQSPEIIVITNIDDEIEYVNEAFVEKTGYSLEEVMGENPRILQSGNTPPETYAAMWEALSDGQSWKGEFYNRRKDGTEFIEFALITPIRQSDGTVTHYAAVKEDITEKKQNAQELDEYRNNLEQLVEDRTAALSEAEFKYRTVADFTYDWESWVDSNGKWLYCSPSSKRITGYNAEDFINRPSMFLELVHPDDFDMVTEHLTSVEGDDKVHDIVFRIRRKDGEERWLEHVCQPVFDMQEKLTGRRATNRDITDRKLAELALIEARTDAETANHAKSAFLANMSHEIRTPMNAIIGLTHLMQRAAPTPEQRSRLTKIDAAGEHLLSIINDILDLSKIEAGKLNLEQTDFKLDGIFDHIQSMLRDQAEAKGLTIEVDLDGVPYWLHGDPTRLRQALLNYAGNAIKFTENGTICLSAKIVEEQGDEILIRFEVEDTGIGIEADKLSGLFTLFEQADTSTTRKYGGTGLGLVITQRLAQLMGGDAGAESEPGRGSNFWFTVRLFLGHGVEPETSSVKRVNAEMELRGQHAGSRILLVEDNAINLEVASELLSGVGMAVDTAENGREAVEKVRTNIYDLILMDIQMPEMDGLEATYLIRAMKDKTDLPILAMTANVFEEYRQASLVAGMNGFVAKPVNPENLFSTIVKWLPLHEGVMEAIAPTDLHDQETAEDAALHEQLATIKGIDMEMGLRNMRGDVARYLRYLHQLDNSHGEDMPQLSRHLEADEFDDAVRIAHTLKGVAGTLGLPQLLLAARMLEEQLRSDDGQRDEKALSSLMEAVSDEQKNLHAVLETITRQTAIEPTIEADPAKALEVLDTLRQLLEIDNMTAGDLFLESEALLTSALGVDVEQLGKQIEVFDYPAALLSIESISAASTIANNQQPSRINSPINPASLYDMFGDNTAKHQDILRKFVSQAEAIVVEIDVAFGKKDADQVSFLSHKLKSSSRMVGADALADLCLELETAGRDNNWPVIAKLYPELSPAMALVSDFINQQSER